MKISLENKHFKSIVPRQKFEGNKFVIDDEPLEMLYALDFFQGLFSIHIHFDVNNSFNKEELIEISKGIAKGFKEFCKDQNPKIRVFLYVNENSLIHNYQLENENEKTGS